MVFSINNETIQPNTKMQFTYYSLQAWRDESTIHRYKGAAYTGLKDKSMHGVTERWVSHISPSVASISLQQMSIANQSESWFELFSSRVKSVEYWEII